MGVASRNDRYVFEYWGYRWQIALAAVLHPRARGICNDEHAVLLERLQEEETHDLLEFLQLVSIFIVEGLAFRLLALEIGTGAERIIPVANRMMADQILIHSGKRERDYELTD